MEGLRVQSERRAGLEVCSVWAGGRQFGVPIRHVIEILGRQVTRPVPLAPDFIGGLVHYRGEVLTTVSLRRLLNMPAQDGTEDILVFEGASGYYGLLVDAVGEVLTAEEESLEGNPATLGDREQQLFTGTCRLGSGLMVMLDPERLDPERLQEETRETLRAGAASPSNAELPPGTSPVDFRDGGRS